MNFKLPFDQKTRRRLLRIFRRLSVSYDTKQSGMTFPGHGSGISADKTIPNHDLSHEAGHWLVSTSKRRRLANFGLGAGPDGDGWLSGTVQQDAKRSKLSDERCQAEEKMASIAGIIILEMAGGEVAECLKYHGWRFEPMDQFDDMLRKVSRRVPLLSKAAVEAIRETKRNINDTRR